MDKHEAPNPVAARLAEAMSEISERCWYAGWLKDTEFVLWSALQHGPMPWGHGEITEADIRALKALSEAAGGWVRWSDEGPEDHVFVDRDTWLRLFQEWEAQPATRERTSVAEFDDRTFRGPHYTFVVLSRRDLKRFASAEPFAAISITNPLLPEAELAPDAPCSAVLRLQFHDVGDAGRPLGDRIVMTHADAEQILDFVERHRSTVRTWVCQCEAGVSRSAAVAAALSRILQGDDRFFFANFAPNPWVYRVLLEASQYRE